MDIMELLKNTKFIITLLISIIISTIMVYNFYLQFNVDNETKHLEIINRISELEDNQIILLKHLTRRVEHKMYERIVVSDAEWDEYLINSFNLYRLKVRRNIINKSVPWTTVERIR